MSAQIDLIPLRSLIVFPSEDAGVSLITPHIAGTNRQQAAVNLEAIVRIDGDLVLRSLGQTIADNALRAGIDVVVHVHQQWRLEDFRIVVRIIHGHAQGLDRVPDTVQLNAFRLRLVQVDELADVNACGAAGDLGGHRGL